MGKPKVEIKESCGYYHIFIDGYHNPDWCLECQERGTWKVEATDAVPEQNIVGTQDLSQAATVTESKT